MFISCYYDTARKYIQIKENIFCLNTNARIIHLLRLSLFALLLASEILNKRYNNLYLYSYLQYYAGAKVNFVDP